LIAGAVVSNRGPVVPIMLRDASGHDHALSALVDTGFTGWLTLPKELIAAFGLDYVGQTTGVLADGSPAVFDTYRVRATWDDQPITTRVYELESEPLIGMRLLQGFRLVVDAVDGGPVRIERL
jgi:clan AA aspartic protease